MRSRDFKHQALQNLKGNWIISVIACVIALLLGGVEGFSFSYSFNVNLPWDAGMQNGTEQISLLSMEIPDQVWTAYFTYLGLSFLLSILLFIVGSGIMVGYARFNLDMAEGVRPKIRTLFSHFRQMGTMICARLLVFLRVCIGFMFFIIPGIIAMYQYALVPFVIADNPGITAREALRESKRLMKGNKWKYFCLTLGFLGWSILAAFTGGLGYYVLIPYMQASYAGFYRYAKVKAKFYV